MPDLDLLIQAARESGDIALRYFRKDPQAWDKSDGAGPVSEADLAVNAHLETRLQRARPDHGWLSEESEDTSPRQTQESVFIIDPIDGTRAFLEGAKHWSHSLAIARNGQVETAVVYLPVSDKLYTARRGQGAFLNGTPITTSPRQDVTGAEVLANKNHLKPDLWPGGVPAINRNFRSSLAYRMCLVAEGRFDAMFTLRPTWEWDVAAGTLIATEAGAKVGEQCGQTPRFNTPKAHLNGLVAAPEPVYDNLIKRLEPLP